ncbi:MAG TPA: choice-of-anchor J domain-containing protein [Ignavibacteria bacterium]|nr:choice-of-anchor J domain-containing protein [Ignavibacteria bacterium]HMR41632.1 choice-of-anchor J domain-containing protein [Ignavibacteria bacterium]
MSGNNPLPAGTFGSAYYQDNFDGANDTISLKNRGYKIFYRSGGVQGIAPLWFQGNSLVFNSFNGPANGYLAAGYQVLSSANNLDNWLILPKNNTSAGDSIIFYSRSVLNSEYPDSVRVMYSQTGDSIPEGNWIELGRYKASIDGNWKRIAYGVSATENASRFAIRYNVINGGPGGINSDYIGIDALTLERTPGANDMAVLSIDNPSSSIYLPSQIIAPKATFKNVGTSAQTNIPVSFRITGPVNYTSNKIISSLPSGATVQGIFDSTFFPLAGDYNVTVYSSMATDGNRLNDTIRSTFSVSNLNYGNSASYFYANSTIDALPAPSKPQFCWKDTSGSTSLEVNGINIMPGITTGDLDDGYWKILLPGNKKVRFFGNNYDTIRIGTNGIISFRNFDPGSGNWNPPLSGIPGGEVTNAIYPLWNDLDFSDTTASITNRVSYKVTGNELLITYDRAPVYSGGSGNYVSFQISVDVSTAPVSNSRILFQYSDTTSGRTGQFFINNINNNTLGSHLIGLQNISSTLALTYRFRNSESVVTPGKIFNQNSGSLAFQAGPDASQLTNACMNLDLTGRLQLIQLSRRDSLYVDIRSNTAPFSIIETKNIMYDSLNGTAHIPLNSVVTGSSYFITVSHRNSITTWSSSPVVFSAGITSYDFSAGLTQAFGNNMILINGKSSFYTGDVSRDGCVDLSDLAAVVNKTTFFTTGDYIIEDLNFDNIVDLTDLVGCHNNTSNFVCAVFP